MHGQFYKLQNILQQLLVITFAKTHFVLCVLLLPQNNMSHGILLLYHGKSQQNHNKHTSPSPALHQNFKTNSVMLSKPYLILYQYSTLQKTAICISWAAT
jgi:hypothetical protein